MAQPAGSWSQTYGFDAARRLHSVASPAGTFTYTYKGATALATNLALPNTAAITNGYDSAARLLNTSLRSSGGAILNQHVYQYSTAGQRQRQTLTDGSYTTYGYDNDGQLISSLGYTSGGVPVGAEQVGFGYDAGWNVTNRTVNGWPGGYQVNDLNELTGLYVVDYYGNEVPAYDANGNLVSMNVDYSAWIYSYFYDDENRLTGVTCTTSGYPLGWSDSPHNSGDWKTEFDYDGVGRLRQRIEYTTDYYGYNWVTATTRYIYDGMRVVQERSDGNVPQVCYTRGRDLSGTFEGAGGIGGLLARSHGYSGGSWTTHNFYHADGSGNIRYMVNSSQAMVASYKYDSYGRMISSSGALADANVYRFSSKEVHAKSGMYYYGYRFYDPVLQRWISRDLVSETGFERLRTPSGGNLSYDTNPYLFAANRPVSIFDGLGLESDRDPKDPCAEERYQFKRSVALVYTACIGAACTVETVVGGIVGGSTCVIAIIDALHKQHAYEKCKDKYRVER